MLGARVTGRGLTRHHLVWKLLSVAVFLAVFLVGVQMCVSLSRTDSGRADWLVAIVLTVAGAGRGGMARGDAAGSAGKARVRR